MSQTSIAILGAGVSGATTAVVLALLGYDVTIYADHRADRCLGDDRPAFASLYPAASVIPHAVTVDDPVVHTRDAQACFEVLRRDGTFGVRRQLHYEVFEHPVNDPDYAPALHGFERLPADGSGAPGVPRRPGAERVYGWSFDVYFAETPAYLPRLFDLIDVLDVDVRQRHVSRETLSEIPGDVLVNCLGAGSQTVFPDARPATFLRGLLVLADPPGPAVHQPSGRFFSYNYTPSASCYSTATGEPAGVYAYPRTDAWVLGGTKQSGRRTDDGDWMGEPVVGSTTEVSGYDVPDPVLDVNAQILRDLTGLDPLATSRRAICGYRYARDLHGEGVRLGIEEDPGVHGGRPVIHNAGHGGAGVTLSWSCAARVAGRLLAHTKRPAAPSLPSHAPVAGSLQSTLSTVIGRLSG